MRQAIRITSLVIILLLVIAPVIVWWQSLPGGFGYFASEGRAAADIGHVLLRLIALVAFTLIFIQIVTNGFRTVWQRIFPYERLQLFHLWVGRAAFLFALTHPIMLVAFRFYPAQVVFWPHMFSPEIFQRIMGLGTIALYILIITVSTAVWRKRVGPIWRRIHIFNYIVFFLILSHSTRIGSDLQTGSWLRLLWLAYSLVVIVALIRRLRLGHT